MSVQDNMGIKLIIHSRLDQVRLVRAALCGVLDHLRVVEADITALELAVAEVVNNCVEHGYGLKDDALVKVQIEVHGEDVSIQVIDEAAAFPADQLHRLLGEPAPLEDPDEEWSMRGHGLQIVRQIVDKITIRSNEEGNVLTFSKHVALRES